MHPIDQKLLDGSKLDGSNTWRVNAIKKEIIILYLIDKYTHWLIPKFTLISKRARLTPKQLAKMIIGDSMTSQDKDLLTEILYIQKAVIV